MSRPRGLSLAVYAAAMGMELCWLYLGLALMIRAHLGLGYPSIVLILLLYPLALACRLLATSSTGIRRFSLALVLITVAIIVCLVMASAVIGILTAGYPPAGIVMQLVFCGLGWWLGTSIVRDEIEYQYICFRFQVGILVLLVLAMFGGGQFVPVILFFTLAAFALALARWENSLANSAGALRPFRLWLNALGAVAVIIPGTVMFLALSPAVARVILQWLSAAGRGLSGVLTYVPAPSTNQTIEFNFSCAFKPEEGGGIPPTVTPTPGPPIALSPAVFWSIVLAVFLGVLFVIYLTVRRMGQRRSRATGAAAVETISVRLGVFAGLVALFRKMRDRLWAALRFLLRLGKGGRRGAESGDDQVRSVRALYRSFLQWAAQRAVPRAQSETPLEYQKALSPKFPGKDRELEVITGAYVQARYGRKPASLEQFRAAKEAWRKIRLES